MTDSQPQTPWTFRGLQLFVFLGALLLFTLEPLTGRLLVPHFGGGFQVWTTCLMVFQILLVFGYLYCHKLAPKLGAGHFAFVAVAFLVLPVQFRGQPDFHAPIQSITLSVCLSIGLPFLVLSSTSVIAQSWLLQSNLLQKDQPYQLYAASNLGSLLGLFSYPFIFEHFMTLSQQKWLWSGVYILYFGLAILVYRSLPRATEETPSEAPTEQNTEQPVFVLRSLYWFLCSALPCMLLLSVTNTITQDAGSFPFLWTLPLGLYTLTFVLIFQPSFDKRSSKYWVYFPEIFVAVLFATSMNQDVMTIHDIPMHLLLVFTMTWSMHWELYRRRPEGSQLTRFYLFMSLGGATGGTFVALLAPKLFHQILEYPLSLALIALLLFIGRTAFYKEDKDTEQSVPYFWIVVALLVSLAAVRQTIPFDKHKGDHLEHQRRNYYGLHRVIDQATGMKNQPLRLYIHGTTTHGAEVRGRPGRVEPLYYYHQETAVGLILNKLPASPQRWAVVGLGAGSLAYYNRANDHLTFFELDPENEDIARTYFQFLKQAHGQVEVKAGDARLTLQSEADGQFDTLLVDAFSSDAIPTHLLTQEALKLYRQKLKPGGLLFFHITNRYYALQKTLESTCDSLGLSLYQGRNRAEQRADFIASPIWVAILTPEQDIKDLPEARLWTKIEPAKPRPTPWSDDYISVVDPLLRKWREQ